MIDFFVDTQKIKQLKNGKYEYFKHMDWMDLKKDGVLYFWLTS